MESNKDLIERLVSAGVLRSKKNIAAFSAIDRRDFVQENEQANAYRDIPLQIGAGQTISQPFTVAFMLELLDVKEGMDVLDVGSGSGWTTALLAHIVGPTGSVIGVERIKELVLFGIKNLSKYSLPHAHIYTAQDELGWPQNAPYDRILVSAASEKVPSKLKEQLKTPGILLMPVRNDLMRITKDGGRVSEEKFEGFAFVPLVEGE